MINKKLDENVNKKINQKPNRLFLKWKAELERYTDVQPVFNKDPPMTTTIPK